MRRSGFTLVETMFAVALFSFAVAVVGPLLVRISRQSNIVTGSQRRTAALSRATSAAAAVPFSSITAGCRMDSSSAVWHNNCVTLTDSGGVRKVVIVVIPIDSGTTMPDTVLLYRVNPQQTSPFYTP